MIIDSTVSQSKGLQYLEGAIIETGGKRDLLTSISEGLDQR